MAMRWFGWVTALLLAATPAVTVGEAAAVPARDIDNVAILVIDNFQQVPGEPRELPSNANCPYSPEDVNVVGDQGAGDDLPAGVPHGKAVYSLLATQLDATAGLVRTSTRPRASYGLDASEPGEITAWAHRDRQIVLVAMDHDHSTTGEIAGRLRRIVDAMQRSELGFSRFVLNMSFVIAPCHVAQWLKQIGRLDPDQIVANYQALIDAHPGLQSFQSALDDLAQDPDREGRILRADPDDGLGPIRRRSAISEFYGQMARQNEGVVRERIFADPLKGVIDKELNTGGRRVIPVAAAGNGVLVLDEEQQRLLRVRFSFPFAPALWNTVVSVSASDQEPGSRASYSNSGEVNMDGNWAYGSAKLQGTSFATPRLAVRQAVHLLIGGQATCQGHVPTLGYTDSGSPGQSWDDLPVRVAAATYCTGFTGA